MGIRGILFSQMVVEMSLITDIIKNQQATIESLRQQLADMTVDRDELLASQWIAVRGAAELAIEKCKNSTGQRRVIDLYVSPNQCAEDILDAIKAAKEQGK